MRGRAAEPWWGTVLEAPDPLTLAEFYSKLLDWPIVKSDDDGAALKPPDGFAYVSIQRAAVWERPTWPPIEGRQHMTMHLDIEVAELGPAIDDAVALGATLADFQPQDNVRVMLDPAGHPFCLYLDLGGSPSS